MVHQVVEFRPSEPSVDLKPSVRIEQQAHGRWVPITNTTTSIATIGKKIITDMTTTSIIITTTAIMVTIIMITTTIMVTIIMITNTIMVIIMKITNTIMTTIMTITTTLIVIFDLTRYSTEELSMAVAISCLSALLIGFLAGFLLARCLFSPFHSLFLTLDWFGKTFTTHLPSES